MNEERKSIAIKLLALKVNAIPQKIKAADQVAIENIVDYIEIDPDYVISRLIERVVELQSLVMENV